MSLGCAKIKSQTEATPMIRKVGCEVSSLVPPCVSSQAQVCSLAQCSQYLCALDCHISNC